MSKKPAVAYPHSGIILHDTNALTVDTCNKWVNLETVMVSEKYQSPLPRNYLPHDSVYVKL